MRTVREAATEVRSAARADPIAPFPRELLCPVGQWAAGLRPVVHQAYNPSSGGIAAFRRIPPRFDMSET